MNAKVTALEFRFGVIPQTILVQPKDSADKVLDAYELEREIEALTEPVLPDGIELGKIQTLAIV